MDAKLLLWPMLIHALITALLYIPMSRARVRTVKEGKVRGRVYKLNQGEPEESLQFTNAIRNQNETAPAYYGACLTAFVLNAAGPATIGLAWLFLVAKTVHVYVHITSNELRLRRPLFMVAYVVLILFWLAIGAVMAGLA